MGWGQEKGGHRVAKKSVPDPGPPKSSFRGLPLYFLRDLLLLPWGLDSPPSTMSPVTINTDHCHVLSALPPRCKAIKPQLLGNWESGFMALPLPHAQRSSWEHRGREGGFEGEGPAHLKREKNSLVEETAIAETKSGLGGTGSLAPLASHVWKSNLSNVKQLA